MTALSKFLMTPQAFTAVAMQRAFNYKPISAIPARYCMIYRCQLYVNGKHWGGFRIGFIRVLNIKKGDTVSLFTINFFII